jgi:hypothetical protein
MERFDNSGLMNILGRLEVPSWPDTVMYAASHGSEILAATLAVAIIVIWLRLRAVSRAAQTLRGEMRRIQMQLLGIERLQFESEKKYGQFDYRIGDLDARQRRAEARLGKPDTKLAVALTRAGASSRELVDCGLSHGESHLLHELNAKAAQNSRRTERAA